MSEGRELLIRAIRNGIVIDHIPSEKVFAIVEILKLKEYSERITVAANMPSSSLGRKGIIKIEEKILEEKELNNIALLAPNVTINIIEDYKVIDETKFVRIKENTESSDESTQDKKTRYKCFYCEKVILEDEIQIQ